MCRECDKAMETVKHILNMCEPKGFSLCKERHDRAILIVLWRWLKEYRFKQEAPWYKLEAKPVYENRSVKILWDPSEVALFIQEFVFGLPGVTIKKSATYLIISHIKD